MRVSAEALELDTVAAIHSIQSVRPGMTVFLVSVKCGSGMESYLNFPRNERNAAWERESRFRDVMSMSSESSSRFLWKLSSVSQFLLKGGRLIG